MATNDVFNPTLQPVTNSPSISPRRLEGSANMLGAVGDIGKSVLEIASIKTKEKVLTDLNSKLQSLDQEAFLQRPEDMEKLTGMVSEYATQDLYQQNLTQNPTFQTGEEVDAAISTQEQVKNDLLGQISRFKQAQVQGSMSATEFKNRALAATREAVALNPQLTSELLTTLSQHMTLSGASNRLEMIEKSNKAFLEQNQSIGKYYANILDGIEKGASAKYYDPATGLWDSTGLTREIEIKDKDNRVYEAARKASQTNELLLKNDILDMEKNDVPKSIALVLKRNFNAELDALLKNTKPEDLKANLDNLIFKYETEVSSNFDKYSSLSPVFKNTAEGMKKYFTTFSTDKLDLATGKVTKELLENKLKAIQSQSEIEFYNTVGNPQLLEASTKIFNSQIFQYIARTKPDELPKIRDTLLPLLTGTTKVLKEHFVSPRADIPSTGQIAVQISTETLANSAASPEEKANARDVIKQSVAIIKNNPNQTERYNQSLQIIGDYAKADPKKLASLSPEDKADVESLINDNNIAYFNEIKKDRYKGVSFSFTPDGLLSADTSKLVSDNPTVSNEMLQKQFQTGIVDKVNDSLKAYANLNGISTKAAAQDFFTKFYKDTFDNAEVPKMDYESMAKKRMPGIAMQESGNKMYNKEGTYITPYAKGEEPADPKERVFGKYQIMIGSAMNPGMGVKPLNFNLSGAAFDKDQERFATEYYTALLNKYKGDEEKALTAYHSGTGRVDNLIAKFGNDWYAKGVELYKTDKKAGLGKYGANYASSVFKKSGIPAVEGSAGSIQKAKTDAIKEELTILNTLEKNHGPLAQQLYSGTKGKAEYISNQLAEKGISVSLEEIAQQIQEPMRDKPSPSRKPVEDILKVQASAAPEVLSSIKRINNFLSRQIPDSEIIAWQNKAKEFLKKERISWAELGDLLNTNVFRFEEINADVNKLNQFYDRNVKINER